jgi:Spy/CpxP family protein refolding chaperone
MTLASFGCLLALFACDKDKGSPAPAASAPAASTTSAAASASASAMASAAAPGDAGAPIRMHAGPALMMVRVADGLELKDTQQATIDKLEAQLDVDDDTHTDLDALHDDLIAGVKAGKIDTAKLDPRIAAIQKNIQARLDKEAGALNTLFSTLEPAQRKDVTRDVREKQKDRDARFAAMAADASKPDVAKGRLERLTKELDLDAAQQTKVQAVLAGMPAPTDVHAERKKQLDALLTSFEGETFDAKKLDAFKPGAAKARIGVDKEAQFLSQLVPVLKPEQRDVLAARLDLGKQGGGRMRGNMGHVWPFPFEEEPGSRAAWDTAARGKPPRKAAP